MPSLVTRELMHFQQKVAPQTLLDHGIKEGGADLPTSLLMGFRICQAYYRQATDKKLAIADILNTKDFERLLAGSGYAQTL